MRNVTFAVLVTLAFISMPVSAGGPPGGNPCPPGHQNISSCGGGDATAVGVGVGIGVGVAEAEANAEASANASVKSTNQNFNTNKNYNTNQQQQGQVQGQQQGQNQTATGGNAHSNATGGSVLGSGNSHNTNLATGGHATGGNATGGNATIESGAVKNTNLNTALGGAGGQGGEGGEGGKAISGSYSAGGEGGEGGNAISGSYSGGGSVNIEDGAVENNSNATATVGDNTTIVNNNFGGEDGNGALATQNVEGSTQVVEGSTTNVSVDSRTDYRHAPVAGVAPVFSTVCSGSMSFQARELGISVGDAEHYCKLLQLADTRFAQAQTVNIVLPTPPVLAACDTNVPDYTKGSPNTTQLQKDATASCFRQNEAAMADYNTSVVAYNSAIEERAMFIAQADTLVNDAEAYVRGQRFTSNIGEQSRKLMYPVLLVKAIAILFF